MKKINTHGLKINLASLEAATAETVHLPRELYQIISFDRDNGDVIYWCGMHDNWPEYRDPAIIRCLSSRSHHSAQAIADAIYAAMAEDRRTITSIGWRYDYDSIWE